MEKPTLLDQVRAALRVRHMSYRTEQTYVHWIKRLISFHNRKHPLEMGEAQVSAFLSYLAVEKRVAASTQNQALCAILFLYRNVLKKNRGWIDGIERAKRPRRLPVVFTRDEVRAILACLDGVLWIMAALLYGSGLRLMECLRLRVKGIAEHVARRPRGEAGQRAAQDPDEHRQSDLRPQLRKTAARQLVFSGQKVRDPVNAPHRHPDSGDT
ncbi:phage integrase N-terminal SAM-like domain-containing protein [Desulfatiglans anilini]|uniref:phage integrase N-terminal SAM-like domain-containing protein n=1 Tax=Desulfatiglans anilini TaxID=90728 RepID=UPI000424E84A|nr:phage integrase N-terminal SAM-like domain-containing protein [Desulfatiglans anilini]